MFFILKIYLYLSNKWQNNLAIKDIKKKPPLPLLAREKSLLFCQENKTLWLFYVKNFLQNI